MGTNYYVNTNLCNKCERCDKIHIGKSSVGWRFIVKVQQPYYGDTEEEFIEFLRKSDGNIFNEYDEGISFDELMDKIQAKKNDKHHTSMKAKQDGDLDFVEGGFS